MRSQSYRMTSSDPKDDWVDGSWTVDCVCGVNYDDGEEMVDCDDCGVWVHTRCSRYVKSEKSFACEKCKGKNSSNDSEETEVAQLLVELPTKTMRMDNSNRHRQRASDDPPRKPFKLWAETPMEDRVHIQGIPGGDPALFSGLSSVFTPQLWMCAGYVPKKFNFQYREFPCCDKNEEVSTKIRQESENPIDKGVDMLFSLSKETVMLAPINTSVGMNERGEQGNDGRELSSKEMKKWEGESLGIRHSSKATLKERSVLKPSVIYSSKIKEHLRTSKDRSGKKRSRDLDEKANIKSTVIPTSNAKEFEFHEVKIPKFIKNVSQSIMPVKSRHTMSQEILSVGKVLVQTNLDKPKSNIVANEHPSGTFYCDAPRHDSSGSDGRKEEKDGHRILSSDETSSKSKAVASLVGKDGLGSVLLKVEDVRKAVDNMDSNRGHLSTSAVLGSQILKPPVGDTVAVAPKVEGSRISKYSNVGMLLRHERPMVKVETKIDHNNSLDHISECVKNNDSVVSILQSSDNKARDVENSSEVVSDCHADHMEELSGDHYQPNQELKVMEGFHAMSNSSSKPKDDLREVDSMSDEMGLSAPPPVPSQHRMVVCVGKSPSTPSTNLLSKPSFGDLSKPVNTRTPNPIVKQHIIPGNDSGIKKDHVSRDVIIDENGFEMPRKNVKERTKSSGRSALKNMHSSKTLQSSVSKHTRADSKDPVVYTSSRASLRHNAAGNISPGESVEPSQPHSASLGQNKITSSGSLQKGEKVIQSSGQSLSKVTLTRATHPPAPSSSPATFSDEELALLLHQELNSSPRVPRVPRVRQAGSFPRLASPTGTSLLKRTSSFGGKDHSSVSRRKGKNDKDGSNGVHEVDYEAKKDRILSSPSGRRKNSGDAADASNRKKVFNGSPEVINLIKKNIQTASSETTNSVPSSSTEATGQNSSSVRNSPSNISDDNTSVGRGSAHRTLPGLISEIMSKGRRMTYEELCNAVLPHWKSLRKHNGERYAYSSHFQAVLDCLRNRTEWAQLVDRGPKTNASRKRCKVDSEQVSFESEDEHIKGRTTENEVESKNLELHQEDVPKGKRNARKCRLALQGRGIKEARQKRKVDVGDDDEDEISPFSNSSEEGLFSDDEFQGGCPVETEDSASSDET